MFLGRFLPVINTFAYAKSFTNWLTKYQVVILSQKYQKIKLSFSKSQQNEKKKRKKKKN